MTVVQFWLLDAQLGHLPAAYDDKIWCFLSFLQEDVPWAQRELGGLVWMIKGPGLPKLLCRLSHGAHIPATYIIGVLTPPQYCHTAPGKKVVCIPVILKQHLVTPISTDIIKTCMTLGGSSCGYDLLPVTSYFIQATGSGLKTLVLLLNVDSKRSALARNALWKQCSSLHIVTFWTFFCISLYFPLKHNLHHRQQGEAENSHISQI